MSEGIVEGLEVVDIEHQQAELPPGAYATRKLPFQEIFQGSTVHKAGQRIGKRESAQSFIQNLQLLLDLLHFPLRFPLLGHVESRTGHGAASTGIDERILVNIPSDCTAVRSESAVFKVERTVLF